MTSHVHTITGAFGYSGRSIARLLLDAGEEVRNVTGHPGRPDPFGGRVETRRLAFDDPAALRRALEGTTVLYNTWWVRFAHGDRSHARAVAASEALIARAAAKRLAGCTVQAIPGSGATDGWQLESRGYVPHAVLMSRRPALPRPEPRQSALPLFDA